MADPPVPMTTQMSDLAWLAEERMIMADSSWWPRIRKWQREGLVRLRWGNSALACYVQATEKGREAAGVR